MTATQQKALDLDELRDRLAAISMAIVNQDDREAQAIIRTTLAALAEQADDKADMTIKLPAHHIPIGLLGADVRYRYIAHQYAEAYAREAVRLNTTNEPPAGSASITELG